MFTEEPVIPRTAYRKMVGSVVSCCMLGAFAITAFAQQGTGRPANAAPRPAAAAPLEDRRPPLFLKETFPMPKKEEIYISQTNVSDPNVELKLYGQTLPSWQGTTHEEARRTGKHGGLEIVWRDTPKDDPTFVFFGPCNTPCAMALRNKEHFVDLTDLAKIKWRTKQTGFHHLQPIIKTADGKWYIGDYLEGPSTDWLEREFSIIDIRWKEFDEKFVTTKGNGWYVPTPDLTKVDEIGFTSLASGAVGNGGHGASSAARVDWIEVYGRPVRR